PPTAGALDAPPLPSVRPPSSQPSKRSSSEATANPRRGALPRPTMLHRTSPCAQRPRSGYTARGIHMIYDRHWVLWDGECGFCRKTARWLQGKDERAAFQVIAYQNAPTPPMTAELRASCKNAVHVITRDGQI